MTRKKKDEDEKLAMDIASKILDARVVKAMKRARKGEEMFDKGYARMKRAVALMERGRRMKANAERLIAKLEGK